MNDPAVALAGFPQRRDFAFSTDPARAAWIDEDALEWLDDDTPGPVHRLDLGLPLAEGTTVELVDRRRVGLCRPIDAGVEILAVDLAAGAEPVQKIAALATPRTCLLPRLPGEAWQLLAVTGFDGTAALLRIDWVEGTWSEVGRLPHRVDGGVWLEAGERLALNLVGDSGRSSAYAVDLATSRFHLLFEASPDSDDRAVLFDPATGHLVVTTDAPGYRAVGVARLGDPRGVRFLPALDEGDEAGRPCGFVGAPSARRLLLHHEVGPFVRLRTADLDTLEISGPLPVPDGEVGRVLTDGATVRFAFSAPDLPWRTARLLVDEGRFVLDAEPADPPAPWPLAGGRAVAFGGPGGRMPALVVPPGSRGHSGAPGGRPARPTVVALHGGPIARGGSEFNAEHQLFACLGLPVVALDYPGSTGSGQALMRAVLGRAGSVDVDAVASVMDAIGGDVILYGESYGAFLALATAARRPCAGVIAFAPFASFASLRRSGPPEVRDLLDLLDQGNPLENGRNLLESCRTIRGRVLIAHGTADRTIPADHSRRLAARLRERQRDGAGADGVHLVELDGQGHELGGRHALERWYREIIRFVEGLRASRSPAQRCS